MSTSLHSSSGHFEVGASGTFRACCGAKASSSGSCRAFCTSAVARRAPIEHFAVPEQIRAAPVEHSAAPGRARAATSRASCGAGLGSSGHFASQLRLRARLERPFRAICGSGPGSTGHFEPFAAPGQARCRKRQQVRCFRARPSRVRPKPRKRVRNPRTEGNFSNRYNRIFGRASRGLDPSRGRRVSRGAMGWESFVATNTFRTA